MIIRKAILDDLHFIVTEGKKFLEYHPANLSKQSNDEYLINLVTELIKNHVVLIAETNNKQVGMIIGMIIPNLFNPNYVGLQEIAWWVTEDARDTLAAIKLFTTFEQIALEYKVHFISMTSTVYTPQLDKIYKKKKYKPVESSYIKEL